MKLNREQIVKVLECCAEGDCDGCPRYSFYGCMRANIATALALIRELTEENERLQAKVEQSEITIKDLHLELAESVQIKADTLKDIQIKFAMHFGTYRSEDSIKVSDVFALLEKFTEEMLEEA